MIQAKKQPLTQIDQVAKFIWDSSCDIFVVIEPKPRKQLHEQAPLHVQSAILR